MQRAAINWKENQAKCRGDIVEYTYRTGNRGRKTVSTLKSCRGDFWVHCDHSSKKHVRMRAHVRVFACARTHTHPHAKIFLDAHAHSRIIFRCARARTRTRPKILRTCAHVRVFENNILLVILDHFVPLIFEDLWHQKKHSCFHHSFL